MIDRGHNKSVLFGKALMAVVVIGALHPMLSQTSRNEFEVASIKVNAMQVPWNDTRDNCGLNGMGSVNILAGGRIRAQRTLLACIIQGAYLVRAFQIFGGPDWVNSIHYDIDAKATNSSATPEQMRQMLQSLLADRFRLKLHNERRELPVYVLTIARNGLKLRPPKAGSCNKPGTSAAPQSLPAPPAPGQAPAPMVFPCGRMGGMGSPGGSRMDGGDVPVAELVRLLTNQLHRPVIDRTGLKGTFDIHLTYAGTTPLTAAPAAAVEPSGPTIFDAVQEQLGLRLESSRVPTEVVVIDSVQKPTEN